MTKLSTKTVESAVAVVPSNAGMITIADVAAALAAKHIVRQTRAIGVSLPSTLYFEPTGKKLKSESGEIKNAIWRGAAQIFDANNVRPVGYAPSQPRIDLYKSNGNAYNKAYDEKAGDFTATRWQPYVALSHAVFAHVKSLKATFTAGDIAKTVCAKAGIGADKSGNVTAEAAHVIVDTLRDLRTFGFVIGDYVAQQSRTVWQFNAKADSLKVIAKAAKPAVAAITAPVTAALASAATAPALPAPAKA